MAATSLGPATVEITRTSKGSGTTEGITNAGADAVPRGGATAVAVPPLCSRTEGEGRLKVATSISVLGPMWTKASALYSGGSQCSVKASASLTAQLAWKGSQRISVFRGG